MWIVSPWKSMSSISPVGMSGAPLGFPFGCPCNQPRNSGFEISVGNPWEFPPCLLHFLQCQVQRIPAGRCLSWKWWTQLRSVEPFNWEVWRRKNIRFAGKQNNLKGSFFSRKFPSRPCLEPAGFFGGASTFMLKCKNAACTQRTHKSLAGDM